MFDFGLAGLLYPKAITLYVTIAAVLLWQLYYCYRLKSRSERVLGTHHAPYIAYSACIIIWIGSNAYFHTDLLVNFGSEGGVFMAKLANLASFFSFAFAYYFSCQLLAEQKQGYKKMAATDICTAVRVFTFINLRPDLTVENVSIQGPSEFVIEFGSQTAYFFNSILILITLTLINLARMRVNSSKLTLAKSNYMIAGILVFMLSTTAIHLGMTYFLGDFSLTWLPPALSISEMLFLATLYSPLASIVRNISPTSPSPRCWCAVFCIAVRRGIDANNRRQPMAYFHSDLCTDWCYLALALSSSEPLGLLFCLF